MITFTQGDLLAQDDVGAIVNAVNCVGVMVVLMVGMAPRARFAAQCHMPTLMPLQPIGAGCLTIRFDPRPEGPMRASPRRDQA